MKRRGFLYNEMMKFENIERVFDEVCANTSNKVKARRFKEYKCINIFRIYDALKNRKYAPATYYVFYIYEPKKRRVVSQTMFDKVINHLVARYILMPAIEPCLLDTNVASRINKGTCAGLKYYYDFRRLCKIKYGEYYILKCDIKKFFASINHQIVKEKLKKKIKDKDALNIIFNVIDNDEYGLSIGSMTSQILAIFYLNDFDHFVKEVLKIEYYVRYQDDFLLFHPSKDYLKECLKKIEDFLKMEDLVLNKKTRIYDSNTNFLFLGRDIYGRYGKYRIIKKKINQRYYLYSENLISLRQLISSIENFRSLSGLNFGNLIKHCVPVFL